MGLTPTQVLDVAKRLARWGDRNVPGADLLSQARMSEKGGHKQTKWLIVSMSAPGGTAEVDGPKADIFR